MSISERVRTVGFSKTVCSVRWVVERVVKSDLHSGVTELRDEWKQEVLKQIDLGQAIEQAIFERSAKEGCISEEIYSQREWLLAHRNQSFGS